MNLIQKQFIFYTFLCLFSCVYASEQNNNQRSSSSLQNPETLKQIEIADKFLTKKTNFVRNFCTIKSWDEAQAAKLNYNRKFESEGIILNAEQAQWSVQISDIFINHNEKLSQQKITELEANYKNLYIKNAQLEAKINQLKSLNSSNFSQLQEHNKELLEKTTRLQAENAVLQESFEKYKEANQLRTENNKCLHSFQKSQFVSTQPNNIYSSSSISTNNSNDYTLEDDFDILASCVSFDSTNSKRQRIE